MDCIALAIFARLYLHTGGSDVASNSREFDLGCLVSSENIEIGAQSGCVSRSSIAACLVTAKEDNFQCLEGHMILRQCLLSLDGTCANIGTGGNA